MLNDKHVKNFIVKMDKFNLNYLTDYIFLINNLLLLNKQDNLLYK
jgi:hypothetical protein